MNQKQFKYILTRLPVDEDVFSYETVFVKENVVAAPSTIFLASVNTSGRKFPTISLIGLSIAMLNEDHLMQRKLEELAKSYNLNTKEDKCMSLGALLEMV